MCFSNEPGIYASDHVRIAAQSKPPETVAYDDDSNRKGTVAQSFAQENEQSFPKAAAV